MLVATMRASGAYTVLVSGGFTAFAEPIGRSIGFDEHRANTLLSEAERFTGLVAEPILGREAKEEALLEFAARLGLDPAETLAVGDGANDIGMIRRAGLGVAYRAKPALRAAADAAIDHADLTACSSCRAIRREEFVLRPDSEPDPAVAIGRRSKRSETKRSLSSASAIRNITVRRPSDFSASMRGDHVLRRCHILLADLHDHVARPARSSPPPRCPARPPMTRTPSTSASIE